MFATPQSVNPVSHFSLRDNDMRQGHMVRNLLSKIQIFTKLLRIILLVL